MPIFRFFAVFAAPKYPNFFKKPGPRIGMKSKLDRIKTYIFRMKQPDDRSAGSVSGPLRAKVVQEVPVILLQTAPRATSCCVIPGVRGETSYGLGETALVT